MLAEEITCGDLNLRFGMTRNGGLKKPAQPGCCVLAHFQSKEQHIPIFKLRLRVSRLGFDQNVGDVRAVALLF
jgi:hypothetical protein